MITIRTTFPMPEVVDEDHCRKVMGSLARYLPGNDLNFKPYPVSDPTDTYVLDGHNDWVAKVRHNDPQAVNITYQYHARHPEKEGLFAHWVCADNLHWEVLHPSPDMDVTQTLGLMVELTALNFGRELTGEEIGNISLDIPIGAIRLDTSTERFADGIAYARVVGYTTQFVEEVER